MPANKYLISDRSTLLKNKVEKISTNLQNGIQSGNLNTKEQYLSEAIKVLNEFYRNLKEPQIRDKIIEETQVDDIADADIYNEIWNRIVDDLTIVFSELENIEDLTVANFNFITTEANRLTARLKSVSSKLGDYILYSTNATRDSFFYKDSFNDLSKIDFNSTILNNEQLDVNETEGIVTLPVNKGGETILETNAAITINPNSNGIAGNNQQLEVSHNGNISTILDDNPDTWFEYERVVSRINTTNDPLKLDITINLGEDRVLNFIRINPNNFGTKTVLKIENIATSTDGEVYTSIKDDIPLADFVEEDEENIFTLAPSTSKYAGQGLYTFTPRKAKYVNIVLTQSEPYSIQTSAGQRLRYAIGIRDIQIRAINYRNIGELISRLYEVSDEVRKVTLNSNQSPTRFSEIGNIKWFISPDDGGTWHEIQPREFDPISQFRAKPEILEFNGPSVDSINTPVPVRSLRVKAVINRQDSAFEEGSSAFSKSIETTSETHQVPENSPFTIELLNPPVSESITIVDTLFGSRGIPKAGYLVGHGQDRTDQRKFRLPFTRLPRPFKKVLNGNTWHIEPVSASEYMHVEIGGEEWSQATQPLSDYTANYETLDIYRVYSFDPVRGILEFGNGQNTLAPPENAPISVWFDSERLYPNANDNNHVAKLEFSTSSNKDDFTIKRYDKEVEITEILPRKATIIRLDHSNITDRGNITSTFNGLGLTEVTFINGKDEFISTSQWSIDDENGIIYTGEPTPDNRDISIRYTYGPIVELTIDQWDWARSSVLRDSVSIFEDAWKTIEIKNESLPADTNIKILDLSKFSIEKGTLKLELRVGGTKLDKTDSLNPFRQEVNFIDGRKELGGVVIKTTEDVSALTSNTSGVAEYTLKENILKDDDYKIVFSEASIFTTEQTYVNGSSELGSVGDYSVSRDPLDANYGKVYVKLASSGVVTLSQSQSGVVTYFYSNISTSKNGLYSVDYKLGRIYTQLPLDPNNDGNWTLTATYQYTDFRAEYRIARFLNPQDYEVDIVSRTVTFKDSEILKYTNIPKAFFADRQRYYLVNYDYVAETRENITELQEAFSPVIKDYALRVLTKGNIF